MKTNRLLKTSLLALCGSVMLVASSALATLVTWDLNPGGQNGNVGSSSYNFTVLGYTIVARGYDTPSAPHELFFKNNGGDEIGLGLVNTTNNELQVSNGNPLNYIQLDLRSILSQGFTNGKVEVGSVQTGESFWLYGSNTVGNLGSKLTVTPYSSAFDDQFVSVPNFGVYKFLSVVAAVGDVLPVAFQASISPVPEMSALGPIIGLMAAIFSYHFIIRQRKNWLKKINE